ncbi:hypothetical protein VTK73DRAFT_8334 [Phialemonium thermophilum]|uniref:Uncharacterized protein n=1 Tax=Phialemonium thermophilum TaxID=223376 RepID=A0ABR3Y7N6_9PEZI
MSLWRTYRNLPFKGRLGVGFGLLAWGVIGMYMADRVEEKFGLKPTEEDKAALDKLIPKIHVVERDQGK